MEQSDSQQNSNINQQDLQQEQSTSSDQQQITLEEQIKQDLIVNEKEYRYQHKQCETCNRSSPDNSLCSKCRGVYYCNADCQRKDWPKHKQICLEDTIPRPPPSKRSIDQFQYLTLIGEGNFSEIYSARCRFDKQYYAIKFVNKKKLEKVRKEKDILMEKHCLKKLEGSPWVIRLYNTFQDEFHLYIQMEYVDNKELWHQLKVFGLIQRSLVQYFLGQIVLAIESMQEKGIVHRDLKTENIMLTKEYKIKLVDFGTARDMFDDSIKGSGNSTKGKKVFEHFVGTPNFMSPEQIRNKDSNFASDMWAFACIAFQMYSGFPAYIGNSDYLIFEKSLNKQPVYPEGLIPEDLKDLIQKILIVDWNQRINVQQVKQHAFFKDFNFQNIGKYQDYKKIITKSEQLLIKIKEQILANKEIKGTPLHEKFVQFSQDIMINEEIDTVERKRLTCILNHMEKQFRHYYKIQDFDYEYNIDELENFEEQKTVNNEVPLAIQQEAQKNQLEIIKKVDKENKEKKKNKEEIESSSSDNENDNIDKISEKSKDDDNEEEEEEQKQNTDNLKENSEQQQNQSENKQDN